MADSSNKPNIIFIALDTLRSDRLACYGYEKNTSPNIDRFAEKGILFENAIASSCWTLPSQASMFTGLFPSEHGATDEHLYLDGKIPTLAEILKADGYSTLAYSADNGWLTNATNITRGFDYIEKFPKPKSIFRRIHWEARRRLGRKHVPYSERVIRGAKDMIRENVNQNKPFFLYIDLMDTHMPYKPGKKFMKKFGLDNADPSEITFLQDKFQQYRAKPESLNESRLDLLNRLYDASVATVDKRLRPLFRFISSKKLRENTVVIITSDHGECLGEHGLLGHWFSLHDTLLKVPLIISWPSRLKPARISQQVQQRDLFYTILDLTGHSGDESRNNEVLKNSYLCAIERGGQFNKYAFAEHAYPKMNLEHVRKYNPSFNDQKFVCKKQAIRSDQYKYIWYGSGSEELFDLKKDPDETENIINDRPQEAAVLRKKLEDIRLGFKKLEISAEQEVNFNAEVEKRLKDLGYL